MKFHHTLHKKLWDWLAKHPGEGKDEALKAICETYDEFLAFGPNQCTACTFRDQMHTVFGKERYECQFCPLEIVYSWQINRCLNGAYHTWGRNNQLYGKTGVGRFKRKAIKAAERIRDWPVKIGLEVD